MKMAKSIIEIQTVLGKHTKIKIPDVYALWNRAFEIKRVFGLRRTRVSGPSMVPRPFFEAKELRTRDRDFRERFAIGDNECWMDPKDLVGRSKEEDGVFTLKKRRWQLSRGFRKVVKFVSSA